MVYSVEIGSIGSLPDNVSLAAPDDIILGVMSVRLEDRQQSTVISAPIIDVRAIHSLNNELNFCMHYEYVYNDYNYAFLHVNVYT